MTSRAWQKRVDQQKEHANKNLTSWFLKTFSSSKTTQYLRDQDEQAAQAERQRRAQQSARPIARPSVRPGQLQAVARASGHGSPPNEPPKPLRQRSFLRRELLEMKRQSAETLLRAQQRMDGQLAEETLEELTAQDRFSDDEDDDCSEAGDEFDSDDEDALEVHELDDALSSVTLSSSESGEPVAPSSTSGSGAGSRRKRRSSSGAKRLSRRSSSAQSAESLKEEMERRDSELAEREQTSEMTLEVSRRLSQATQLYAEAIDALDSALHPDEFRSRQPVPEPQPLLLGAKKATKSEWI